MVVRAAGIILAGGYSSRMGKDKALLPLPGDERHTFVSYLASVLATTCEEVVLVARDGEQAGRYKLPGIRVVTDYEPGVGPLMGIYTGLCEIRCTHALIVAVDLPCVQASLVSFLLSQALPDELVVPVVGGIAQVLLAVYPQTLLPLVKERLQAGRRDPRSLLEAAQVRYIEEAQLRAVDPQLRSFLNVNTPEDLARVTAGGASMQ
jgi:molybdopterin-guanine dinucleotide biosynthesis protein A